MKINFDQLDDFSKFFQHFNYNAYHSRTDSDCYMLKNSGSSSLIVIMLTPQYVTIHRGYDDNFYSCPREDWGPDFFEKCGRKEGECINDYESIAEDYRSYCTLDNLGKFLVDECRMKIECERRLIPQICHLIRTVYDSTAYYTLTINFREDRTHFDFNFETFPFNDRKSHVIKYNNMTDWSVETLEKIGKELPIDILTDNLIEYKKKFVQATMKA